MTAQSLLTPVDICGSAAWLELHEKSRYRAAAAYAGRLYPGPLGELVHRELSAYAEFGRRFSSDALIPRLATSILAMRLEHVCAERYAS
jgi:hypothetical protein